MYSNILTLILGGGAGTRLFPLTKIRAKPAVPLGGKYRLIDIAISNCINSNIRKIYVLTQYLSASLNRHVSQTYAFDPFQEGFADILAAEQRAEDQSWFQGTADAVRKHWNTIDNYDCDLILILPGDALYRMDIGKMVEHHRATGAQISVAVNTVEQSRAHHFGLLEIDDETRITNFREKPKTREEQAGLEAPDNVLQQFGVTRGSEEIFLASMGIYLFDRKVLDYWMNETTDIDFGKEILPKSIHDYNTRAFIFDGYWEDIGTIDAFYQAHMDFLKENPPFEFAHPKMPIYTRARFLPSSRFSGAMMESSVVADGCSIGKAKLHECVIGLRSSIGDHTTLEHVIMMGADYYDPAPVPAALEHCNVETGIGKYCHIRRAIIDKNVRIGDNVKILNEGNVQNADGDFYHIREGIIIIPKNAVVPSGTVL